MTRPIHWTARGDVALAYASDRGPTRPADVLRLNMEALLPAPVDQHEIELVPDGVLPCQLDDRLLDTARLRPEKRLQLAVLQDAVSTFHRLVGARRHRTLALFSEVDAWFASDDTGGPFTFVTICDTLNIEPDYIRRGLQCWRERLDASARKPLLLRSGNRTQHVVVLPPLRRSA